MSKSNFKIFIDFIEDSINRVQEQNKLSFEKEAEIYYYKKMLEVAKQIYALENTDNNQETRLKELEEENEQLKKQLKNNQCDKIKTAREIISEVIAEKVKNSVRSNLSKYTKTALKREILEALKWKLQVRYADNLKEEHIEMAKEFVQNYQINDFYIKEQEV